MDRSGFRKAASAGDNRALTSRVAVTPAARRDLERYALWLRDEAGAETASRFAKSAILTFGKLAQSPHLGPPARSATPRLERMRKWRIDGFPKVLIFYRPSQDGIEVIRVLHAAADWWSLLDID